MKKRLPIILTLLLVCIAVSYASAANVAVSPQNLSVDGIDADCDKYNIDGSNYFKLRDLGDALGFRVCPCVRFFSERRVCTRFRE